MALWGQFSLPTFLWIGDLSSGYQVCVANALVYFCLVFKTESCYVAQAALQGRISFKEMDREGTGCEGLSLHDKKEIRDWCLEVCPSAFLAILFPSQLPVSLQLRI